MNWECLGRQPLASTFRNGNIDRADSRRRQRNPLMAGRTATRDRTSKVVERAIRSETSEQPKGTAAGVYRGEKNGRSHVRSWLQQSNISQGTHLHGLHYVKKVRWNWRVSSVASCELIRVACNINWIQ
jgi:hypothetical protein